MQSIEAKLSNLTIICIRTSEGGNIHYMNFKVHGEMLTNEQNNVDGETFQSTLDKYGFTSSKPRGCKDSSIKRIKPKTILKGKKQR